ENALPQLLQDFGDRLEDVRRAPQVTALFEELLPGKLGLPEHILQLRRQLGRRDRCQGFLDLRAVRVHEELRRLADREERTASILADRTDLAGDALLHRLVGQLEKVGEFSLGGSVVDKPVEVGAAWRSLSHWSVCP